MLLHLQHDERMMQDGDDRVAVTVIIQKWDVKSVNDLRKLQDLCLMTVNCTTSQKQPTAVFYAQFHPENWEEEAQLREQSANSKPGSHMDRWFICTCHRVRRLHRPKNKTRVRQMQWSSQRTEFDHQFC